MLFDILCTFNSTEDSGLEFLKHLCRVSNGTVLQQNENISFHSHSNSDYAACIFYDKRT